MVTFYNADMKNIQGQQFDSFGRCIYCDSDGGVEGLRDEHIIPYSMHGNTLIKKASCRSCERILTPVDRHLARDVFGNFRIHSGVQTRNPKDRPPVLPATFLIDGEKLDLELPIKDHPFSLALPIWGEAGFFRSVPIGDPFPDPAWNLYHFAPLSLGETLNLNERQNVEMQMKANIKPALFARAIAKIAYCHAVLKYGLYGFRRLALPDVILGKCPAVSYFVGSPLITPPPRHVGVIHALAFSEITCLPRKNRFYVVDVRLFAASASGDHGMPFYHVLVGAPLTTGQNPDQIKQRAIARAQQKSPLCTGGKILVGGSSGTPIPEHQG